MIRPTAHMLACGAVFREHIGAVGKVEIWMEHGVYHVRGIRHPDDADADNGWSDQRTFERNIEAWSAYSEIKRELKTIVGA